MPQLALAPWEILPGVEPLAPADAVTLVPWNGSQVKVAARLVVTEVMAVIFVRPTGFPLPGCWTLHEYYFSSDVPGWRHYYRSLDARKLVRLIRHEFQQIERREAARLGRVFVWEAALDSPITWAHIQNSGCRWHTETALSGVPFEWRHQDKIMIWDAPEMKQMLEQEWEDKTSDARFSFDWMRSTPHQQAQMLSGSSAKVQEMESVMRWVLQSTPWLWNSAQTLRWDIIRENPEAVWIFVNGQLVSHPFTERFAIFQEWQRILVSRFDLALCEEVKQRHRCAREGARSAPWLLLGEVTAPPTAQEQLEIRRELRQWIDTNLTPEEKARLQTMFD